MDYEIRFSIIRFDSQGKRKELFRNSFKVAGDSPFPFSSLVDVFGRLFPGSIIEFVTTL